jgi:hypothetical protein
MCVMKVAVAVAWVQRVVLSVPVVLAMVAPVVLVLVVRVAHVVCRVEHPSVLGILPYYIRLEPSATTNFTVFKCTPYNMV